MSLIVSGVKLYNVREIADMLKSTEATIRSYFRDGILKGRKINGKWHVTEDNLKYFITGEHAPSNSNEE